MQTIFKKLIILTLGILYLNACNISKTSSSIDNSSINRTINKVKSESGEDYSSYVNPLIGTASTASFSHGNTLPIVAQPLPMISVTPDMSNDSGWENTFWIYKYYNCNTNCTIILPLTGFRLTHQPSPWIGDYGDIDIMPLPNEFKQIPTKLNIANGAYGAFNHENESAKPYLYQVLFNNKIKTSVSATRRAADFLIEYPQTSEVHLVIDLNATNQGAASSFSWNKKILQNLMASTNHNSGGTPKGFKTFYALNLSLKNEQSLTFTVYDGNTKLYPKCAFDLCTVEGAHLIGLYTFNPESSIQLYVGSSFINGEFAQANLQAELGKIINKKWQATNFDDLVNNNHNNWNKYLSRVELKASNDNPELENSYKIVYYSALYRALINPHNWTECTKYNFDGNCDQTKNNEGKYLYLVHRSPYQPYSENNIYSGYMFSDEGTWDNFRTKYPYFSLVYPDIATKLIQGWLNAYDEGGWLPQWASPGYRTSMTGTHMDCIIADAAIKNVQGFDQQHALEALLKDAYVDPIASPQCNDGKCGRAKLNNLNQSYYIPNQVTETLDYAHDNYCISQLAHKLGDDIDATKLLQFSNQYINAIYNPDDQYKIYLNHGESKTFAGEFHSRNADGSWANFDSISGENPLSSQCDLTKNYCLNLWGYTYTEGGAWHYMFDVPFNIDKSEGLMALFAASDHKTEPLALADRLDSFFTTTSNFYPGSYGGTIHEMAEMPYVGFGQFAFNDQPVWNFVYLYNYTNQAWKTACIVRNMMNPKRGLEDDSTYKCFPAASNSYPATKDNTIKLAPITNNGWVNQGYKIAPATLFGITANGLLGDEDNGSMSAWYLFSAIGLYPITGSDDLLVGSPVFTDITIKIPSYEDVTAKVINIKANDNSYKNIFVKQLLVNGKKVDLSHALIKQSDLVSEKENTLDFTMQDRID